MGGRQQAAQTKQEGTRQRGPGPGVDEGRGVDGGRGVPVDGGHGVWTTEADEQYGASTRGNMHE